MKALVDPHNALASGLMEIRRQFKVPKSFPVDVLRAADVAAQRTPTDHVDRTSWPFVTLDPASSTDLDQAFIIERNGSDLLLRYAIADVAWFVDDGSVIDAEAWRRGTTLYLPVGKAGLYPPVLSEGAASLLPGSPRPAAIFTVKVATDGGVTLEAVERAIVCSTAKLAYDSARVADLPADFAELATRIQAAEERRGAARVDPPEQEVADAGAGQFGLVFRPRLVSEDRNAALSLAANLAIARALQVNHTGLFRVMPEPDKRAVKRLRHTARALGVNWPAEATLTQLERTLNAAVPKDAALMLAIRRASPGASYVPYRDGVEPWHSAMAGTYTHATAPLRRLADRYVVRAILAVAKGELVPENVAEAFRSLPRVMAQAEARSGQIERAVIDLAEAVMLSGMAGRIFRAIVTDIDERGVRIQLCDLPVVARLSAQDVAPGAELRVKLTSADPKKRLIAFQRVV